MEDQKLRHFCMVVECAGFSRAAQKCGLTQSAISHLIKNLENELNTKLLMRHGRCIRPTPAGQLLYRHARAILAGYVRLNEDIQELLEVVKGDLNLGAGSTAANHLLPQLLYAWGLAYPQVCPRVAVQDERRLLQTLADGTLDFAILEGNVPEGYWLADKLAEDELIVIASENHVLAEKTGISLDVLAHEAFIGLGDSSTGPGFENGSLQALGLNPSALHLRLVAASTELVLQMVKSGLGLAVISKWAAFREIREGLVVALDVALPRIVRPFQMVRTEKVPITAVSRAFLNFVSDFRFFVPF